MNGYTLSDKGTFLKMKKEATLPYLKNLSSSSTELINIYSAYLSSKCAGDELVYAEKFIEFLSSVDGQKAIAGYGTNKYGEPLFYPAKENEEKLLTIWRQLSEFGG